LYLSRSFNDLKFDPEKIGKWENDNDVEIDIHQIQSWKKEKMRSVRRNLATQPINNHLAHA